MATKPTVANVAFATDANFSAGPASGTPTKVAPASIAAQGWRPGHALGFVGAWFNYLLNQYYLWCAYVDDLHNSADFLNKSYTWVTGTHRFTTAIRMVNPRIESGDLLYTDAAGTAAPRSVVRSVPFRLTSYNGSLDWSIAGAGNAYTTTVGGGGQFLAQIPIGTDVIPQGAVLTLARGWGDDDGGDLTVEIGYYPVNHTTGAIGAWVSLGSQTRSGTNTLLDYNPFSGTHTIDHTSRRYSFVLTGNNVGATNKTVNDLYVAFNDPGFVGN